MPPCSFGFCARLPNPANPEEAVAPEDPLEAALPPPPAVFLRKSKRPPPPPAAAGAGAAADAPAKPEKAEKALGPS